MTDKPENIGTESLSRAEQDRIDLGHELSGDNVGRIQRFSVAETMDLYGQTSKEKQSKHRISMLAYLLAEDAQYAQLYRDVQESIDKAQRAVDQALNDIDHSLDDSAKNLQRLRENAADLEDGTKVFLSEDGSVYTENGTVVHGASVTFDESNPSWEDYKSAKDEYERLSLQKAEIETYQREVLHDAKRRMSDENDPVSMEELKEIEDRVTRHSPAVLHSYLYGDNSLEIEANNLVSGSIVSSGISKTFDSARLGISDLELPLEEPTQGNREITLTENSF